MGRRAFHKGVLGLVAVCALAVAGAAAAYALAPHSAAATCTLAQKVKRKQTLVRFKASMAANRAAFFRRHKSRKARIRFVHAQQQTLARLARATRCTVAKPGTTATAAAPTSSSPTTTQPGSPTPPTTTTRPRSTTSTTRSTSTSTSTTTTTVPPTTTTPTSTPGPANVVVVKKGFSETTFPSVAEADYGVVLVNTSSDHDAKSIQVTVNAVNASDAVIATDSTLLLAIPAGGTYYVGGELVRPNGSATARLDVQVSVGQSTAKAVALPAPANVRIEPATPGGVDVVGEVSNAAASPLHTFARVTAVVFDGAGNPIGGNSNILLTDVPHGSRIGFKVHVAAVAPASAVSAVVSIEPRYVPVLPSGPPVAVVKTGFTEAAGASTREDDYGVVLHNTSAALDGIDVTITVNAVDAGNVVVGTEGRIVSAIPAGGTYYFGGAILHFASRTATTLEVYVQVAVGAPPSLVLPGSANVHVVPAGAGSQIAGELVNTAGRPLSSLARVTGVVFDGSGNVIGGGGAYQPSTIQPGQHAAFTINAPSVPSAAAASAQVSAEPKYN